MSKHTEAPWHHDGADEQGDEVVRSRSGGSRIAIWPTDEDAANGSPVAKADARLIAAAPELLDACLNIDLYADDLSGNYGDGMLDALRVMRDAIARATGTEVSA